MARTGANTSRTSKPLSKNADRKAPSKSPVRTRSAAPVDKVSPVKSSPKPAGRHESRKRESLQAPAADPRTEAPRKRPTDPVVNAKDTKTMKKTTGNTSRSTVEEKGKRASAPPPEPAKTKAVPPPKETRVKAPKTVAPKAAAPTEAAPPAEPATRRKRDEGEQTPARAKAGRGSRSKSFGFNDELMQDYVMDGDLAAEGVDEELTLEPMELPLELLDPELVEVPRPAAAPKPKPKSVSNRRQQACANCGNTYNWLSVDQLCFNCLKKKLSQRKREDESYPGFTGEAEEEEEAS